MTELADIRLWDWLLQSLFNYKTGYMEQAISEAVEKEKENYPKTRTKSEIIDYEKITVRTTSGGEKTVYGEIDTSSYGSDEIKVKKVREVETKTYGYSPDIEFEKEIVDRFKEGKVEHVKLHYRDRLTWTATMRIEAEVKPGKWGAKVSKDKEIVDLEKEKSRICERESAEVLDSLIEGENSE